MGINAFVAFGVCAGMGYTPQEALGAVLVAGVLFLIIKNIKQTFVLKS
jgi:AGZA family xanthine/uracil permease-like MFS transporter